MLLLKNGKVIENPWLTIEKDLPSPLPQQPIILSYSLLSSLQNLNDITQPIGVLFPCEQDIDDLFPYLTKLTLISLTFPTFKDGRAFSQARKIREQLRFTRELRATGQIIPDQYQFLIRTGFSTVEVLEDTNLNSWQQAAHDFTIAYQSSVLKEPREGLIYKL